MHDLNLVLLFLLVSCLSMTLQAVALARLAARRAGAAAEGMVAAGYVRTAACRVLAATVYVAVAAVQLAGDGSLTAEALIVFTAIQVLWQVNSLMDIRIRRALSEPGPGGAHAR
jgi:hypothetical protein